MQQLYAKYQSKGLEILAFPCNQFGGQEPGTHEEIKQYAQGHGATFPIFAKIKVNGSESHPLYAFLKKKATGFLTNEIKWNYSKFLINRQGEVLHRYAPTTGPLSMENDIVKLL